MNGEQGKPGPQGPRGEAGKYEAIHKWRWTALAIWIIAFTTAVLVLFHNNGHRIEDNKRVVAAIQKSRQEACLRTYDAMSTILIFELKEKEHRDISDPERLALLKLTTPEQCRNIK